MLGPVNFIVAGRKAMNDVRYYEALAECGHRYQAMLGRMSNAEKVTELRAFVELFMPKVADRAPIPKLCRWLGYIQGLLITWGMTTVEAERDWTRPLFRPLDDSLGG